MLPLMISDESILDKCSEETILSFIIFIRNIYFKFLLKFLFEFFSTPITIFRAEVYHSAWISFINAFYTSANALDFILPLVMSLENIKWFWILLCLSDHKKGANITMKVQKHLWDSRCRKPIKIYRLLWHW